MKYLALYLLFINIIAVIICITDKIKARRGGWRTPEKTLFLISVIGGAVGMYFTMLAVRHKTRHKKFTIGIPIIILLHFAIILYILHLYT